MFGLLIQNKNFTFDFFKLKERAHITRKIHCQRKVFKWEISIIMNSRKLRWAGPAQQNICLCLIRYLVSAKWSNPSHPNPGRRKKTLTIWPLFVDEFQLPQSYSATTRRQFTFYHQVSRSFSFHTYFWCFKRFYEGLKCIHKTFCGTTMRENKS